MVPAPLRALVALLAAAAVVATGLCVVLAVWLARLAVLHAAAGAGG